MARKTREEALATREGILDAALACFHEHGVAGTSLAAIGERAGYTRGAVYWHFKNKTEVLEAMIRREHIPFLERLRRTASPRRSTPILDLRSAMRVSISEVATTRKLRQMMEIMLRNDLSAESAAMRRLLHASTAEELAIFRSVFARARELGQLREGVDPAVPARILHACIMGAMCSGLMEPEHFSLEGDSHETIDALLGWYVQPGVFTPGAPSSPLPDDEAG
ncbi:MAG: TetR family transcriptional regulator [Stenotrophomonas sp.]